MRALGKYRLLFCLMPYLFLLSCHKTVVVIPEACMTADKTEVLAGDTVMFTNCNKGTEDVMLFFFDSFPDTAAQVGTWAEFDENHVFRKQFPAQGQFTAMVRAVNNMAPVSEQRIMITVNPR